jgi:hypothetical protein
MSDPFKTRAEQNDDASRGALDPDDIRNYKPITPSTFVRVVVIETINDPNKDIKDQQKIEEWKKKVSNPGFAEFLPRNSIIGKLIGGYDKPMFMVPFFPSHLSLPCKPGEAVWAMFEKPGAISQIAFWISRVVDTHQTDDVNHSHPGNVYEIKKKTSTKDQFDNSASKETVSEEEESQDKQNESEDPKSDWSEMRNGPSITVENDRFTRGDSVLLPGEQEDIFERLISETSASKLLEYEPIPRFTKRPGDVVLEGTNNTLVVLGTDRIGSPEKTDFSKDSGSIDIVAGRGQSSETFGKQMPVTSTLGAKGLIKGPILRKEIDKSTENLKDSEGDPDYKSDRSRILISQRTSPDKYFGLESNKDFNVEDSSLGDAAIVIKTDKVRLIARSDIQILVTGFEIDKSPTGADIKSESIDSSNWGSITINNKGEIIIKPGSKALLKLGGEDADKAILCSKQIPVAPGEVTGAPLTDTMGGSIGVKGSSVTGIYASKVLIK